MCYFITLCAPTKAEPLLREEFGRGFMLLSTANAAIRRALSPSFQAWLLTSGMCSCDLYWRPGARSTAASPDELRAKYRKRGWPHSRVEKAVQSSLKAKAKARRPGTEWSGLRPDLAAAMVRIAAAAGPIGLIVHWYSGDVETEKVTLTGELHNRGSALETAAASLPEDALIWVDPA